MRARIAELEAIRADLASGGPEIHGRVHAVGQALRGSGGSFGFPEVTDVGALLEDGSDTYLARHLDGALALLRHIAWPDDIGEQQRWSWLAAASGVDVPGAPEDLDEAWAATISASGLTEADLAERIAHHYALDVADPETLDARTVRLVPPATCAEWGVVPLGEDDIHLRVATADPTNVVTEAALRRLTGRIPLLAVASPARIRDVLERTEEPPAPHARPSRRPGTSVGPATVLLVDDDRGARLMAGTILARRGFAVVEAGSGEEALSLLEGRDDVGLVVVDLNMPGMGGAELLRTLKSSEGMAHLAVVVLTGAEDPLTEAALIEEGADDYIRKPIDPRLFLARVTATLRRTGG